MNVFSSLIVFSSAWYGKIKRQKSTAGYAGSVSLAAFKDQEEDGTDKTFFSESCFGDAMSRFLLYIMYFVFMATSVVLLKSHPYVVISMQHFTVIICILTAFFQWVEPRQALFFGGLFCTVWILSAATSLRWVFNNIVIAFLGLLVSGVHFKNFAFLQMFLWMAVIYDVWLLNTLSNGLPSLFSVGHCETVLCQAFEINDAWELPTIFTFKLGPKESYVFLGAGDIIIGCVVSNFSQMFFRTSKYMFGTVLSYTLAIALLKHVGNEPYPALVTIVPLCTLQVIISAFLSSKTRQLFSLKCFEHAELAGSGTAMRQFELFV